MSISFSRYKDVDLNTILEDYRINFNKKTCEVTTNYNPLKQFKVSFYEDNLPHLLGLHYVSKEKRASRILKSVTSGKLTSQNIMKHHNFNKYDIKNRVMLYPFLHDVFYQQKIKMCIPMDNVTPNNMRLSCVFTEMGTKEEIVLGLRRDSSDGIFKLATLHSNKKAKYTKMKRSKIVSIIWQ
ncbi:PBECR4 domain-containing protein [Enterococcus bulliens]